MTEINEPFGGIHEPCLQEEHRLRQQLANAAMFMRRMARMLRDHPSRIQVRAMAWLKQNGLEGDILR